MRPLLLSGLRHLKSHPSRVLQVVLAVALGVALFVSSYVSISGIRSAIVRSSRGLAGNAEWRLTRGGTGSVPLTLLESLRREPDIVAAPFVQASVTVVQPRSGKLLLLGVDMESDSMVRLYGSGRIPDGETIARMVLVPNSIVVSKAFAARNRLQAGSTVRVVTRTGPVNLNVAGSISAPGADVAFMELRQAATMLGQPGRADFVEVAGASAERLRQLAPDQEIRAVGALSPAAQDALLRVESLFGLSLVAMLIGCFVIYSSVQVTVLERIKEVATFRAIGASRVQVVGAILLEWLILGLVGSAAGVALGAGLASTLLRIITGTINSMIPLVTASRAELSVPGAALGIAAGLITVLMAAVVPAIGAIRESPLLALRPHSYRLKNRQATAAWIGAAVLAFGLWISTTGSYFQSLGAIALSFFGLALLMPQLVVAAAGLSRRAVAKVFGLPGFLAADNLRKAPQRTALNVIALGGALAIMVATASLVQGLSFSTHRWIRSSLPFDLAVMAADIRSNLYSEDTIPGTLAERLDQIEGVTHVYRFLKSFARYGEEEVMMMGIETGPYLEAHRRRGSLAWLEGLDTPENIRRLKSGEGVFVTDNFLSLYGRRVGDPIEVGSPSGKRRYVILGALEDYSWPRGGVITDLSVMQGLWRTQDVTYVDLLLADPSQMERVRGDIARVTQDQYSAFVFDRDQILAVADDVLRQTTAAADVQVWLAALIGFLGIGNSLIMSVLQRQREIGLLRAVGMSRRQLQMTVAVEALLVAIASGLLGMAGGLAGGWLPLRHFTFSVTGYLFPLVIPWAQMGWVMAAALVVGLLASLVPMRQAAQVPVLTAIAYE